MIGDHPPPHPVEDGGIGGRIITSYCAVKSVSSVMLLRSDGFHPVKIYPVRVGFAGAVASSP